MRAGAGHLGELPGLTGLRSLDHLHTRRTGEVEVMPGQMEHILIPAAGANDLDALFAKLRLRRSVEPDNSHDRFPCNRGEIIGGRTFPKSKKLNPTVSFFDTDTLVGKAAA